MTDDPGRRYWPESAIRHVECIAWSLWLPRSSRNLAPPPAVTASSRSARAMRSAVAGTDDPCMNLAPRRNSRSAQPASRPARPAAIAPTGVAALASPRRRVTQRRSGGRSPDLHRRLNRFPPPSPDRSQAIGDGVRLLRPITSLAGPPGFRGRSCSASRRGCPRSSCARRRRRASSNGCRVSARRGLRPTRPRPSANYPIRDAGVAHRWPLPASDVGRRRTRPPPLSPQRRRRPVLVGLEAAGRAHLVAELGVLGGAARREDAPLPRNWGRMCLARARILSDRCRLG